VRNQDSIDRWLEEWSWADLDLPLRAMTVAKRIGRIARHLERLTVETLAPLDLDPGEFDVLATLLRAGPPHEVTPTVLNQSLMISAGGLTKRLARLEERGFVTRRLDDGDRRSLLVTLTPSGQALAREAVVAHSRATSVLIDGLGGGKREELSRLLRRLLLLLEASESTRAAENEAGERREEVPRRRRRGERLPPATQLVD
jgi:DNA-binding MarR family transcriptional regulator